MPDGIIFLTKGPIFLMNVWIWYVNVSIWYANKMQTNQKPAVLKHLEMRFREKLFTLETLNRPTNENDFKSCN